MSQPSHSTESTLDPVEIPDDHNTASQIPILNEDDYTEFADDDLDGDLDEDLDLLDGQGAG
jgi:hypothetical protein